MAKQIAIAFLLAFGALFTCPNTAEASQGWSECTSVMVNPNQTPFEVPNAVRICREGVIAISYDKDMIDPAFSMYYITPTQAKSTTPGRDTFYEDPDLTAMGVTQAKVDSKAFDTNWNKGHLAPSHILSYSTVSKHSCYTMANIAPQGGYFNQHPWEKLESSVLTWIAANKALHIITGVAYKNRAKPSRTADNIATPDYYWKVLCEPTTGNAVGFYGVNDPSTTTTTDYVPVTTIEKMYGGQLFPPTVCMTSTVNQGFWW